MLTVNTKSWRFYPKAHKKRWYHRCWPQSLISRMLCMLVCALLLSEIISGVIWYQQYSLRNDAGMESAVRNLTLNMLSSYHFMSSLPRNYRPLVLQQQLELGGSQFFISINHHVLPQKIIVNNKRAKRVLELANDEVLTQISRNMHHNISLTATNDLRVFNAGIRMVDLPPGWARFALLTSDKETPVLVLQLEMNKNEWLFIAAPLPSPYDQLDMSFLSLRQIAFTLCSMLLVICFGWWIIRMELRPLAYLSQAVHKLNTQLDSPPLPEKGSTELKNTTRAFNQMQDRLRTYLHDKEMLFTAISHDLKTPLTRLRLRVEMMELPDLEQKMMSDLIELERMIKGALRSMKDTDIHEDMEVVDLTSLLKKIVEAYSTVQLRGAPGKLFGRPLALTRCINNLLDNGIKYGKRLEISVDNYPEHVTIRFRDYGYGIPQSQLENVFKPYYRLQSDSEGSGLGLTIARGIARAHGGDIILYNHPCGGLIAVLHLWRYL